MNKLAKNIQKLRKADGLSQEDFAEKVGVTRQTVSRWENDEGNIRAENIENICKAYNISSEQLLGENDFKIITVNQKTGKKINGYFNKSDINESNKENSIKGEEDTKDQNLTVKLNQTSLAVIYPVKIKRKINIRKIVKILIITFLIMYILLALLKFAFLCYIVNRASKYKNVDNYYEEIVIRRNGILNEVNKIWYKDEKYKIEKIRYDDSGNEKEDTIKYLENTNNKKIVFDCKGNIVKEEKIDETDENFFYDDSYLYNCLPSIYKKERMALFIKSLLGLRIRNTKNSIILYYNSNALSIDKENLLPKFYKENKVFLEKENFNFKFNEVTDEDVTHIK